MKYGIQRHKMSPCYCQTAGLAFFLLDRKFFEKQKHSDFQRKNSIRGGGKMEYAYSMNCSVGKTWDRLHGKV